MMTSSAYFYSYAFNAGSREGSFATGAAAPASTAKCMAGAESGKRGRGGGVWGGLYYTVFAWWQQPDLFTFVTSLSSLSVLLMADSSSDSSKASLDFSANADSFSSCATKRYRPQMQRGSLRKWRLQVLSSL